MASRTKKAKSTKDNDDRSRISRAVSAIVRPVISLLFSANGFKFLVAALVALFAYVIYLDATIRSTFEGNKWQLPARVYARPLEIFAGAALSPVDLEQELRDLGYREGDVGMPGSFLIKNKSASQSSIWLHSRGHGFWDGEEEARQVSLSFDGDFVRGMTDLSGRNVPIMRLDPIEIGAIYPAHKEDRILLRMDEIPPLLVAALVAVEDHRFYEHHGISFSGIFRALVQNLRAGGYAQGGSTLTQQLIKNYYLTRTRSLKRKFTEAIMAVLLDRHYSKEAILEAYFNEIYLGQAGERAVHGFGLGSYHYFNRPLNELSVEKLALLIAVIRGPTYYDPWRHPERALQRRNFVLERLEAQGLLSALDVSWAKEQPLNLGKASGSYFSFPAYLDLVKRQLKTHYPQSVLTSEGLKIHTAFDPLLQRSAEKAVDKHLKSLGLEDLEASVVVTEPTTGEVQAVLGGRRAGYSGFNRAINMQRSVGSVIKPFIYLTALQESNEYTLSTLVSDEPVYIEQQDGSVWSPRNYDRQSHGDVPLLTALAHSYNQATARLGRQLGVDEVVDTLDKAGLNVAFNPVDSLFIGTSQLSPLQVSQLYQSIASNGFVTPLKAIRAVLDRDGNSIQRFPYDVAHIHDAESVYLINTALQAVGQMGSARAAANQLGNNFSFAAKTGTSSEGRDAWLAGYTGDLLAVVWVGFDDNRKTSLTGSSGALPIWASIVKENSSQPLALAQPENIVFEWVIPKSGSRSKKSCKEAMYLPYRKGSEPTGRRRCR